MTEEVFKPIPGYEGYYLVSNIGNIFSLKFKDKENGWHKKMKPFKDKQGYLRIVLNKDGNTRCIQVHKVVAMAFLNHKPCGHELIIDHINNIPYDNRLENLQIITQRENVARYKGNFSSKYTGVCWNKRRQVWTSEIFANKMLNYIGSFTDEYQAHLAYQKALANLNNQS